MRGHLREMRDLFPSVLHEQARANPDAQQKQPYICARPPKIEFQYLVHVVIVTAAAMPNKTNYWLDTVTMPAGTEGELPQRVDVVVIGAGITGLAAARMLAKRGTHTAVLEARTIGWGASSRNGGMVLTGTKLSFETIAARYGLQAAKLMYADSLASIGCVEQIVAEENIDCNFARCGHLEVASKQSHFDRYSRAAEVIARECNHNLRIVSKSDLESEIGSDIYYGGLVDEKSATVNPARYVAGLARAALDAGAAVYEYARIERIARTTRNGAPGFELYSVGRKVFAREILVATGGYTSRAAPAIQRRVIPIGSFIIATEPLSTELAHKLSPRNRMIFDSKHYLHYYRLTPDNRILFGGRAAFFPETKATIERSRKILRRDLAEVYPQLRDHAVEYAWGGTLDFCFDTMPHAGRLDDMYFAAGYAGHGVALATHLGTKMANKIVGDSSDNIYERIPFPGAPLGLYSGWRWFLPLAGAYYKLLDWVS